MHLGCSDFSASVVLIQLLAITLALLDHFCEAASYHDSRTKEKVFFFFV
jgi:hypothetical protein